MKQRNEVIKEVVKDFYGARKVNVMPIVKYLTKRNKPKLTEEEKDALWHIQTNLADKTYRESIIESLLK